MPDGLALYHSDCLIIDQCLQQPPLRANCSMPTQPQTPNLAQQLTLHPSDYAFLSPALQANESTDYYLGPAPHAARLLRKRGGHAQTQTVYVNQTNPSVSHVARHAYLAIEFYVIPSQVLADLSQFFCYCDPHLKLVSQLRSIQDSKRCVRCQAIQNDD